MVVVPESVAGRRLTLDDYEALPDDQDYEIIDGRLYVAPRPRPRHQIIASRLAHALETYAERQAGGGGTVIPDADLIVDERNTYVSPDIMYFAGDRFSASDPDERIRILPDLVVEILSPGTEDYDRTGKQALYARLGIPQYWIADAAQRTMTELTLDAGGQYRERTTRAPDPFRPALFSDLAISLSALFA